MTVYSDLHQQMLDQQQWERALEDAAAGHPGAMAFMLRSREKVPEQVRQWLADRLERAGPARVGRPSAISPRLLGELREAYARLDAPERPARGPQFLAGRQVARRAPNRSKKAFLIEVGAALGFDPETLRKMLNRVKVKENQRKKPG